MRFFPSCFQPLALPGAAALAGIGLAAPARAQGAPGPTETSFFQMFFWSDDPVGLIFIWVLVLLSMLSLTLALRFGLQFRRSSLLPPGFAAEITGQLQQRKFREAIEIARNDGSLLGDITAAALTEAPAGYEAMERALFETGDARAATTLRPLEALNVLGNIAPMMGLFGTVYGMIVAFQSLVSSGGSPDPVQLAGGISTALVTTLWGLVVAIPALASYALLHNRVDAIAADAVLEAEAILKPFRSSGKASKASPPRPVAASSAAPRPQSGGAPVAASAAGAPPRRVPRAAPPAVPDPPERPADVSSRPAPPAPASEEPDETRPEGYF